MNNAIYENSKISFVMPAYNCERTLAEAVDSIMQTNFKTGDELIIVNDGSTDGTEEIILKLEKKYPEIKLIRNSENMGCPATRNIGIAAAKNPLIFNMDADDILAENSIAPLKKYLTENDADIATFAESRFFQKNNKKVTHKWIIKGGVLTLADFLAGPITPGGNFLYTKASWEKIGGYWEYGKGLHEFWGFTLKQLAHGAKIVVLGESYYFHRYGTGDSLFVRESNKKDESLTVATKMIMNYIDLIDEKDAEYLTSGKNWFDNLSRQPVRLKTGEIGSTGYKIVLRKSNQTIETIKKKIPEPIFNILKKIYYYCKNTYDNR